MADANRQIVLDRLPQGDKLAPEHFRMAQAARPAPQRGHRAGKPGRRRRFARDS